jgi:hypothetical protein
MKKTITTALTSSLIALGASSAIAQTTISGNLDLSYQAVSADTTTVTGNSYRGFGKESQINLANKGKLSNGIDYAAGFSWEIDGPDTLTTAAAIENHYIDFIFGKTTLSFSADHVNTTDQTLTNIVGYGYTGGDGVGNMVSIYPKNLADNGAFGVGLTHNFGVLRATLNYIPNNEATASNDVANSLVSTNVETATNSSQSLVVQGDLGVKGLNVLLGVKRQDAEKTVSTAKDQDGRRASISYNMGQFTVAADRIKFEGQAGGGITADVLLASELKGTSYGVAYAINKELSLGAYIAKAESDRAGTVDEKTKAVAIGYNLGPVTIQAQYRDIENNSGAEALDGKIGGVKISTKF